MQAFETDTNVECYHLNPEYLIGRTDAAAGAPILWLPDVKSQLIGKDPNAGKRLKAKEERAAEDETVRQHHPLNGHEFEHSRRE